MHLQRRTGRRTRTGLSIIDLAACLPIVLLLAFGTIEATNRLHLQQSLSIAAYEAVKHAAEADAGTEGCVERGEAILASRKIRGATIEFPAGAVDELPQGATIEVVVRAGTRLNSPLAGKLVPDRQLEVNAVMVKQ